MPIGLAPGDKVMFKFDGATPREKCKTGEIRVIDLSEPPTVVHDAPSCMACIASLPSPRSAAHRAEVRESHLFCLTTRKFIVSLG